MRHEFIYGIPIVVILALIASIASDFCRPFPTFHNGYSFESPSSFNPFCYVADFKPEAPEFQSTSTTTSNNLSLSTTSYVGTAISGPSTSTTTTFAKGLILQNLSGRRDAA